MPTPSLAGTKDVGPGLAIACLNLIVAFVLVTLGLLLALAVSSVAWFTDRTNWFADRTKETRLIRGRAERRVWWPDSGFSHRIHDRLRVRAAISWPLRTPSWSVVRNHPNACV